MLTESEKRAAALAVSRYGVDHHRLKEVARAVDQAQAEGQPADLLSVLVSQKLLSSAQANELRQAMEKTHIDPNAGKPSASAVAGVSDPGHSLSSPRKEPAGDGNGAVTLPPPLQELRQLGEFRILRRLGEGGMGSVYLGYQEGEGRQVAIKVLPDHLAANQNYVDRFYREARSVSQLNHPNIVRGIAVGQDQATGKHYLVLEYVDGPSAHALLDRFGRLKVGDAIHIILDIARALEHAHSRNIIHRDIKPDNILLTSTGVAKLADLGLAKRTDEDSHLTGSRQGFGTPYYMPYEQAINAKMADGRSDIYALGATLYHLVTGGLPFTGSNPIEVAEKKCRGVFKPASQVHADVPPVLDRVLDKMLAGAPPDRYQTASEVIVDLERSGLSAKVPSFVDPQLALQDPVVRERLTAASPPTQPDLRRPPSHKLSGDGQPGVWYLRYRDRQGGWCKTRATTQQIVQRIQEGRLPASVEACPQSQGEYLPLSAYAEFRRKLRDGEEDGESELRGAKPTPARPMAQPAAPDGSRPRRQWRWLVPLLVVLAAGAALAWFFFTP